MGFLDKIKNMFTEEVEDDVKVEQIKKEVTHVPIETPSIKHENFGDTLNNNFDFSVGENSTKPVFFDDNDFEDMDFKRKEVKKQKIEEKKPKYEERKPKYEDRSLYSKEIKEEVVEEKKIFKPTPIISPVYGILDKNYHKEDIVSRGEELTQYNVSDKEPSIESIRNKAYGTLEDELENTLFGNNSILFKHSDEQNKDDKDNEDDSDEKISELNDDVLSNLTDDISKELDELLIKKEKFSDEEIKKNVKNNKNLDEEDLLDFIDSTLYKEGDDK